jgi:hypothetical protein
MSPKWRGSDLLESHASSRMRENICGEFIYFGNLGPIYSHTDHAQRQPFSTIVEPYATANLCNYTLWYFVEPVPFLTLFFFLPLSVSITELLLQ